MFRVKQKPDGSFLVFSNDENNEFICTITPRVPSKSPNKITEVPAGTNKRKSVPISPTRLTLSPRSSRSKPGRSSKRQKPAWCTKPSAYNGRRRDSDDDDEDDVLSVSSFSSTTSSHFSFASTISVESSKEPDEDCLDQPSFCRMLDLIESKRLFGSKEQLQEVQRSFPIRKIACQGRWQDLKKRFPRQREQISFSSPLGQSALGSSAKDHILEPVENLISKYDRFCTSSQALFWSVHLLRTRESRARFPVTYKDKHSAYVHEYMFSKKQRKQRANYLNLGLSRQSYRLKAKCRMCYVRVCRLSEETIRKYCKLPESIVEDAASDNSTVYHNSEAQEKSGQGSPSKFFANVVSPSKALSLVKDVLVSKLAEKVRNLVEICF